MSPNLRAAAHRALDTFLDALAAEEDEPKPKRRRGPVVMPAGPPVVLPPHLQEQLDRQRAKNGYKKAG